MTFSLNDIYNRWDDGRTTGEKKAAGFFLNNFKELAATGRGIDIIPRRKNLDSLSRLGITLKICKEEILSLAVKNYLDGPKPDEDRPGEIWEFGKRVFGKEVFIILKIAQAGNAIITKCLSFHEAEFPLRLPFQEEGEKGRNEE